MKIIGGPYRGETVSPKQWANDWISIRDVPSFRAIVSPRYVQLNADEIVLFRESAHDAGCGMFWKWWCLSDDGTFTDLRPPRPVRRSSEEVRRRSTWSPPGSPL